MNYFLQHSLYSGTKSSRHLGRHFAFLLLPFLAISTPAQAGNLTRGNVSTSPAAAGASTSQTTTAATTTAAQASQTAAMAQLAQVSIQRSVQVLQALQAQQTAQSAARNLGLSGPNNLGTTAVPLVNVPDGISINGLLPGVAGTDPSTSTSLANITTTVTPTTNANGTSSVTLGANQALTLPPSATANSQITVSGTGTVGSITTGGTITPLTAGVATTVTPGSTISLTAGGTITFATGSAAVPSTFSTYSYTAPVTTSNPSGSAPVPASWSGVGGLTQSTYAPGSGQTGTPTTVTITQTAQQALLTWQTFNIGKNTTLDFDQSAGGSNVANWVAINKVANSIAPTQVLGAIQAPGQVYVINQNGIIFGGSSQVDVGALVAASLPINDNLVSNGLLDNPDLQFLFSQLDIAAGTQGPTPAFSPEENDPAPGANGTNGGLVAHVDGNGNLSLATATGQDGDVVVEAGAKLSSPATAQNVGGRIALVGPNVSNAGTITTPDGQAILAAGLQVGFAAHNANDPSLRGLDTYIGAITDPAVTNPAFTAGTASNTGLVGTLDSSGTVTATPGSDLMMIGATVNQSGVVDLSTSVSLNSRVDLLADYGTQPFFKNLNLFNGTTEFYPTLSGEVTLGANSLTEVTPDLSSTDTVVGTKLALSSLINIQAMNINMDTDALLYAPSASLPSNADQPALGISGLDLTSGVTLNAGQWSEATGTAIFSNSNGQVTLAQGATIDVSGSENVSSSVAENVVAVQLLGSELANSPLQQDGALRGQTVYVDLRNIGDYNGTAWIGTPLADASGYVNLVQHTVGELTTVGGTVAINAGGSVNMQSGSTVNVSGGWINYQGATVQTTNVVSDGQVINIVNATPNLVYSGIYNGFTIAGSKYGLSQTYTNPFVNGTQYDQGYVQGGNGGGLSIAAPSVTLNGNLYGNTVAGPQQRTAGSAYTSSAVYSHASFLPTIVATLAVPTQSSFSLTLSGESALGLGTDPATPQNVDFGSTGAAGDIVLSPQLTAVDGFGSLTINDYTGNISLPENTPLTLSAGGSLELSAANIDIESNITAPDGVLGFTTYLFSPNAVNSGTFSGIVPPPTASSPAGAVSATGNFTLGGSIALEVGGLTVDDSAATAGTLPKLTNGGSIIIDGYSVFLQPNSLIDASGGAYVSGSRAITYGAAGSISILGGQDPEVAYIAGGQLFIGSTLSAYSGLVGGGGSLTLKAPLVQIGGSTIQNGDLDTQVVQEGNSVFGNGNTLWLDPSSAPGFFGLGGFQNFTIEGNGTAKLNSSGTSMTDPTTNNPLFDPAVLISAGTQIHPIVESYLLSANDILTPLNSDQESQLLPSQRSPVSFSFVAFGLVNPAGSPPLEDQGNIVMGQGSQITTDPQTNSSGGVKFTASNGTIIILGDVTAPGGTISVSGASDSTSILFADTTDALATVELGSQSLLSTAGVAEYTFNAQGYTTGSVLNGGAITIKGNIVAEQGATLDVSGASANLDVNPAQAGNAAGLFLSSPAEVPLFEASNAGSITLTGGQELYTDATLIGMAGGPSAQGGTLSLSSGGLNVTSPLNVSLVITQSGPTFEVPSNGDVIGTIITPTLPVIDSASGDQVDAYFAADLNIFAPKPILGDSGNGGRAGGFQNLILNHTVAFSGPVTITTGGSITVGVSTSPTSGGVIYANAPVVLDAPFVALGLSFTLPSTPITSEQTPIFDQTFNPSYGPGTLTVNASTLADIGDLSLQDIGTVNFNTTLANTAAAVTKDIPVTITGNGTITSTSGGTITSADGTTTTLVAGVATSVTAGSSVILSTNGTITPTTSGIIPSANAGDIQGEGTFDVEGTVSMTAGQIFPPTESFFSIFAYDYNNITGDSSVVFTRPLQSDSLPSLPLSAGGTLNVYASTILQDGVLRAPDGSINLGVGGASATPVDYFTGSGVGGQISTIALTVPATVAVTLGSTSVTSVSQVDPNTGLAVDIPYGIINDSGDWIDPAGNDITSSGNGLGGLPAKSINLSGQTVNDQSGATLDLRGGGDLFAYQFVSGTGGTNDILASNSSFAVIPDYGATYAPYAPYAVSSSLQTNNVTDAGYTNSNLAVGEEIYLSASNGLPAGVYTLLPARYALLPGAFLVTSSSLLTSGTASVQPDGVSLAPGYSFNGLSNSTASAPAYREFQVESESTVLTQADYQVSYANTYFPASAATNNAAVPRLPMDAGQLVLVAGALSLPNASGSLLDSPAAGGLGGEVDIASPQAINIDNSSNPSTVNSSPGVLNLDAAQLTEFGAESLLIGGYRSNGASSTSLGAVGSALVIPSSGGSITFPSGTPGDDVVTVSGTGVVGTFTADGTTTSITGGVATSIPAGSIMTLAGGGTVTFSQGSGGSIPVAVSVKGTGVSVTTSLLTVNNAGESLTGDDVILVSNGNLTIDPGSTISATTSNSATASPLTLVGDGALLRVSSNSTAQIIRTSVHATSAVDPANLNIQSSSSNPTSISGTSVTLDSTNQTALAESVNLSGTSVALDSGQISLEITTPAVTPSTTGLILSGQGLTNLQANAQSLSLLSYSSIDIYNDNLTTPGIIGAAPTNGVYPVNSLALHATDIRGFGGGDDVINGQNVTLDNSSGGLALGAASGFGSLAGTLTINAETISLGSNALQIDQFATVNLNASSEVALTGLGILGATDSTPVASAFNVAGNLNINAPLISGAIANTTAGSGLTSFVDEAISAQGAVIISNPGNAAISAVDSGLAAELQVSGSSVSVNSNIVLHSGSATISATGTAPGSDTTVGTTGNIDVSGLAPNIFNLTKYTNGGSISLNSAQGNVAVNGAINVSALSGSGTTDSVAGNAGSLSISAQNGTFTPGGTINGQGGVVTSGSGAILSQGDGGTLSLVVGSLSAENLDAIENVLNPTATADPTTGNAVVGGVVLPVAYSSLAPLPGDTYVGGFTQSQSIRARHGSIVVDNVIAAATVNLSTDNGDIEVTSTGRIDATSSVNGLVDATTTTQMVNGAPVTTLTHPGATGGSITLAAGVTTPGTVDSVSGIAYGSVVLDSGSLLSAAGLGFNDAGKGGSITLQAGSDINGSAPATGTSRQANGNFGSGVAVINIQTGATIDLSVKYLPIQLNTSGSSSVTLASTSSIYFPQGTPGNDQITISGSGTVGTMVSSAGVSTNLTSGTSFSVPAGSTVTLASAGSTIAFAGQGTGGAITLDLPSSANFTSTGASSLSGSAALTAANQGDLTGTLILQAPQTLNNSDVQIDPLSGTVIQASSIVVAGLFVQNASSATTVSLDGSTSVGGAPSNSNDETQALGNATTFTGTANYNAMAGALLGSDPQGLTGLLEIEPAEEIDNTSGGLVLNNTWDFSQDRFGPESNLPGILTLRAAGNLVLPWSAGASASLTDGFNLNSESTLGAVYSSALMSGQSWSFNLVAGADFGSANINQVIGGQGAGSFILGQGANPIPAVKSTSASTDLNTFHYFQTVRTGTGNITIDAGGNVQIINELATIYTAGSAVSDIAGFTNPVLARSTAEGNAYPAQYSDEGGNVTIAALGNIGHYTSTGGADSSKEMPTSWLYRQGATANGAFTTSTSWWINFSNFLEGVGALGGGNVSLTAGESVVNIDAVAPTNAQMPAKDSGGTSITPSAANLVELGGGDVTIQAGVNIDGGVYYVEKGQGTVAAGNDITTNVTRGALTLTDDPTTDPFSWLPTTLFAGDASFNVSSNGNLLLGPVANPFLLPQNIGNGTNNKSYFSTYNTTDAVNVSSLSGTVTLKDDADSLSTSPGDGSLYNWYNNIFIAGGSQALGTFSQPWLQSVESSLPDSFGNIFSLMPPTLRATAYSSDIDLVGSLLLSPSPLGTLDLAAIGSVNGFQPNSNFASVNDWGSSLINLSDADPANIPGVASPLSTNSRLTLASVLDPFNNLFDESGATQGLNLQQQENLHANIDGNVLHADDPNPVYIYAENGNISGLNLFSGKFSDLVAGTDITDIALYLQNDNSGDISVIDAGRNITAFDADSILRAAAQTTGNMLLGELPSTPTGQDAGLPNKGDIQISGPGTLEVLAGGDFTLGNGPTNTDGPNGTSNGTDTGLTSVGNERNPTFSQSLVGADIVTGAGLGGTSLGLSGATPDQLGFVKFEDEFLNPNLDSNPTISADDPDGVQANRYLPDLASLLGLSSASNAQVWAAFNQLTTGQQDAIALQVYYLVMRDAGRDHNSGANPGAATYAAANEAIAALFPQSQYQGNISLSSREIATAAGGNIELFAPGGGITVGFNLSNQPADQGILTEGGGNIDIFANNDVTVGTSRIFTLDGGNIAIYSSNGNIAAGSASKTVQSAPPTRVLVNAQSAAVETDLAGLATGGGIGVLESQAGAQAGDVDLVAPKGIVDAGDAGIRVSGNLNIAAVQVLNAGNISVGGKSAGVPATSSANIAGLSAASSAAGAGANEANDLTKQQQQQASSGDQPGDLPSIITVEVLGYGGGGDNGA